MHFIIDAKGENPPVNLNLCESVTYDKSILVFHMASGKDISWHQAEHKSISLVNIYAHIIDHHFLYIS